VLSLTAPRWLGRWAPAGSPAAKWLGYVDQLVIFPPLLLLRQLFWPADTRILVLDQALGPWVPWIRHRPHLIVCHDLLALRASRGEFAEQRVGRSGQVYQRLIRWGFRQGSRFLAVSAASAADLSRELRPGRAEVRILHNPLPAGFWPESPQCGRSILHRLDASLGEAPYLLHVGGYWYKNREGVCEVFAALRRRCPELRLVLVGHLEEPARAVLRAALTADPELDAAVVHLPGVAVDELRALYSAAAALLFPSWLEGFGWPVLEALACGCAVITTDRDPMREVGGGAAVYVPPCPRAAEARSEWVEQTAATTLAVLQRCNAEQALWRDRGLAQAARFNRASWLDQLEQALV
jgi:glycosyltransferase involved in cell wall biosynthesis